MKVLEIFQNEALATALISWFVAQFLKVIFVLMCDKKLDFKRFIGSGGMPSSHAAFVVSLAMYVGLIEGFHTSEFAICFVVAFVVMYDAAGVRRAAGAQAKILNQIVDNWDESPELRGKRLKELLGHTPVEVFAGAGVGIAIALLNYFWIF